MTMNPNYFKSLVNINLLLISFTLLVNVKSKSETCYYDPWNLSAELRAIDQYFVSRICVQSTIDKYWYTFGFSKSYWDDGMGYEDCCNWQKPLGRIFGTLYLLENSFSPKATSLNDWSGSAVKWAYPYSGTVYDDLDDLRCKCRNENWLAMTRYGFWVNDRIEYYWRMIYKIHAISRAAVILHEAHHYGIKEGHSCNERQDQNWEDNRPYASETYFLISYYWYANTNTSSTWREYSADRADARIASKFCNTPPDWVRNFR